MWPDENNSSGFLILMAKVIMKNTAELNSYSAKNKQIIV